MKRVLSCLVVVAIASTVVSTVSTTAVSDDMAAAHRATDPRANLIDSRTHSWPLPSVSTVTSLLHAAIAGEMPNASSALQSVTQAAPASPIDVRIVGVGSISADTVPSQSALVGSAFASPLKAIVRDASGALLSGRNVTFTAPTQGATGSFPSGASTSVVTDSSGVATAPTFIANGTPGAYAVVASASGISGWASFALINTTPAGNPWTQVAIPVTYNTCSSTGIGSVVSDPVRTSDVYAFVCEDGGAAIAVLKSTDAGQSWVNVNTTSGAIMNGRPWGAAIDPNPSRSPSTPPTMYTPAGYGSLGLLKSTDGGVTWRQLFSGPTVFDPYSPFNLPPDVYSVTILPDNAPNHIVITFHGYWKNSADAGFGESLDGGVTWTVHQPPAGIGQSHYLVAIDSLTWLSIAQDNGGVNGIWKTTTGGRVGGVPTPSAWRKVDPLEHLHGSFQAFIDRNRGAIYMPGYHGIRRSLDNGDSWSWAYQTSAYASNVIGTPTFLYANYLYGPDLERATRSDGSNFGNYTAAPAAMTQGSSPYGSAIAFDGTRWVIVSANQTAGIWRYVE